MRYAVRWSSGVQPGAGADRDLGGRALPHRGEGRGQRVADRVADRQHPRGPTGRTGHRGDQRCRRRCRRDGGGQGGRGHRRRGDRGGEGGRGRGGRAGASRMPPATGVTRWSTVTAVRSRSTPASWRARRRAARPAGSLVDRRQPGPGADGARDPGDDAARGEHGQQGGAGPRQAAAEAEGVLDDEVAGGGHRDGERRDDGGGGPRTQVGPLLDGQQDRPVGEVDAVAQEPEDAQRPPPHEPAEPSAVVLAGPDDGQRTGQRHARAARPGRPRGPGRRG